MGSRTLSPRRVLGVAASVLLVLCFAPPRFTEWVGWFRTPLMAVVTPASRPAAVVSSWIRPGDAPAAREADIELDEALRQRDDLETRYLDAIAEIERLRSTIRELQGGRELLVDPSCDTFVAPRVGHDLGAGVIEVRGGSRNDIKAGAVAVAGTSQQLVGRVSDVGALTSTIRVITRDMSERGSLEALIVRAGETESAAILASPRCRLTPEGDGTLVGEIGVSAGAELDEGMLARLDDPYWPSCAQRLIVGRVIEVRPTDHPLHRRIVVRPEVDPMHVPGVVLRIPMTEGGE